MIPSVRASIPGVVDSTMRSDWVACPTRFHYSFGRKFGSPEGSTDLIAGGSFAKGLEVLRKCYYGQKMSIRDSYEQGVLAAMQDYGDHQPPEHKKQKSLERVIEALADYIAHYNPATDHIKPYMVGANKDEPCVEFTFSLPLPILHPESGEPILYAGRFDMLGVRNDQLVVVDEKTTSQLGPTWVNKWNLRGQFTGYIWACQQYGYPVLGAIVRGVSFLSKSFGHAEAIQLRAQWEVDQWYEQLLHDVRGMVRAWEENWYDQAFDEACADFSGCPFQSLCKSSTPEAWASKFAIRDWDPLKKVPYVQPEQKVEVIPFPEGV
jgi:hypothetical protein